MSHPRLRKGLPCPYCKLPVYLGSLTETQKSDIEKRNIRLHKKHKGLDWCPYEKYTVDPAAEGQRLSFLDYVDNVYPALKAKKDQADAAKADKRKEREAKVQAGDAPGKGKRAKKKPSKEVEGNDE